MGCWVSRRRGEGTFLSRANIHCGPKVAAAQNNPEPLARLLSLFGGGVTNHMKGGKAKIWYAYGPRARGVMMTLYSLMSERRKAQICKALGVVE